MTGSDPDDDPDDELVTRIDSTRLGFERVGSGVRPYGGPFLCRFDEAVDPEALAETICTTNDPWRMFGVTSTLEPDYVKVNGVLIHIDNGVSTGASEVNLEVAPEWARVYILEDACATRVGAFVRALDAVYGVTAAFPPADEADGDALAGDDRFIEVDP